MAFMRDRAVLDLLVISWLVLFLELACIRWFPSHVMFLTFFTNVVLLACFVGMSVGCLAARNTTRYLNRTPFWLLVALVAGLVVENNRTRLLQLVMIGDRTDPDTVYFGAEAGDSLGLSFRIPVEVLAGAFFMLIGTILVGPGQEMGRAFNSVRSRTLAYSVNLLGSLAGIGSFAACSYWQLPPLVWFAAIALGVGYLLLKPDPAAPALKRTRWLTFMLLLVTVGISSITSGFFSLHSRSAYWSPYYRIDIHKQFLEIETNLVSHQIIDPTSRVPSVLYANYAVPFLLHRDAKKPDGSPIWKDFRRVLIIGAGSGNDLARALQWLPKEAAIDAVEIDPVIQRLGAENHPDKPYSDPRVHVFLNDGRNFLHSAPAESYDLVIFALVDSLVLQLGSGNMRLESFLFTQQAFQDAHRVLKPTGLCAVYNYFRHGWLACRINSELKQAFNVEPVVFALADHPIESIKLGDTESEAFTVFLAGSEPVIKPLKDSFRRNGNTYWIPNDRPPDPTGTPGYFGESKPRSLPPPPKESESKNRRWHPVDWIPLRAAAVEDLGSLPPATDDWPFLYVKEPGIPLVTWRGMAMMVILSLVLWFLFRPRNAQSDSSLPPDIGLAIRSFFLGAGFMLVETKAVVQMALLFGSTWMVNSVVFAAILVMSLAGTLFVAGFAPKRLEPYYLGLFVSAGLSIFIPLDTFLGWNATAQVAVSGALVFLPIAFAGVIFATTFARSSRPDRVFGANIAGALLGGIAENASVVLGFQYLLCVAVGFYLLSSVFGNRTLASNKENGGV